MTLLAKSPSPSLPNGLSLPQHLIEVVSAVARLELRHPSLPAIAEIPNLFRILRTAALLHDLGKAHPAFQLMLSGGPRFEYRHEVFSLAFSWLDPILSAADWTLVHLAVLTHHKDLSEIQSRYPIYDFDDPLQIPLPLEFLANGHALLTPPLFLSAGLAGAHPPAAPPTPAAALSRISAILLTVAQFANSLASRSFQHPAVLSARFLRGILTLADHSASASQSFSPLRSASVTLTLAHPYPHQTAASAASGNVILTAPTGSGKTEAALLWALAQSADSLPLLFYVLPYQASLNAMRLRLASVIPENALALQHGKALQSLYLALLNREYSAIPAQALRLARNEESMARLQTAPVRILSPYQLLRAAYTLPGHEALWTTPTDSLFIFDEIHAYEPGRLAMILATMHHFAHSLRARFFVMTATMPSRLRRLIAETLPSPTLLHATPDTFRQSQRHILHLLPSPLHSAEITARILKAAHSGLAVLVIANTVSRAQSIAAELRRATAIPVQLLHARFHSRDRFQKERAAQESAALGMSRSSGFILVATQVVEVSLNVDFDLLFTEPAPLQALFQRFGRVNRTPRTPRPLKPVYICTRQSSALPYDDEEIQLSLKALTPFHGNPVDEAHLQVALDSVYDSPFGQKWENTVKFAVGNFQKSVLNNCKPLNSHDELETAFSELFDGFEVIPKCLLNEFVDLSQSDPILASQLTVPISKAQFHRLRRLNRISRHESTHSWIIDLPYTELGLELSTTT